jgi:membrane protein YfhO
VSYVEGAPGFEPAADAPPRGTAVGIAREELHRVELDATLTAPGLLVLADSYYPGWRAFVDDEEVAIRPVNHLFRGVPLPAGAHRVRFEYRPASFLAGAALSLLALATWLALAAGPWARAAIQRVSWRPAWS